LILMDAGPMVALISASDRHHESCKATLATLKETLITVWPAVTDAMYLLRGSWQAQSALWEMIERRVLNLAALDENDARRIRGLMEKYRDLPMDLADAALVRVAERQNIRRIFTLDRRDFSLYRPTGVGRFIILPAAR
jgi:predicted nucleic acid-binding protein